MKYVIDIGVFLGLGIILLYGLLHLAQELISRPHPLPRFDSDPQTDEQGAFVRAHRSQSAARNTSGAIDLLSH
jgi:hypothetical protein